MNIEKKCMNTTTRRELLTKRRNGHVYIQNNLQQTLTNINQIGYDPCSMNPNIDLVHETYRQVQEIKYKMDLIDIKHKKKVNELQKEVDTLKQQLNSLTNKNDGYSSNPKVSKDIGSILELLFERGNLQYISFRSFFTLMKSMNIWESHRKDELRQYIINHNVFDISKRGQLEIIIVVSNRRQRTRQLEAKHAMVILTKLLIFECNSNIQFIALNNLYDLFKDMNMIREEKCVFRDFLRANKFKVQTISKKEYIGV